MLSPNRSCLANGFLICSLIIRAIGRAPILTVNPFSVNQSTLSSVQVIEILRGVNISATSCKNLTVICFVSDLSSFENCTIASSLFRNSGLKNRFTASSLAVLLLLSPKPMVLRSASRAPKLDVRIRIVLRALTLLPSLLVIMPLSISCNNTLLTSGCAFSISSSSKIQLGCSSSLLTNNPLPCPPSPYPTYPGGAPISFATVWRS